MTDTKMVPIDFITHNEVLIDAAPAKVWPHIANTNSWHRNTMVSVEGEPGKVGERLLVSPRDHPDVVSFHVINAEIEPEQRRTIRLETPDHKFMGFSTWTLTEKAGSTLLTYDVFSHYDVPAEYVDGLLSSAHSYMDEGLATLKALVEKR
jgi:uncharacterized protein YndB with AHSA1/START domain